MDKSKKQEDYRYPIKLGELVEPLRKEAYEHDRSLHYWIRKILKEYVDKKKKAA